MNPMTNDTEHPEVAKFKARVAELERVMRPLLDFSYEANHEKWIKAKAEAAEVLTRK